MAEKEKQKIKKVLEALPKHIQKEYLNASIYSEADLQSLISQYLYDKLKRRKGSKWIVGNHHSLKGHRYKFDLVIYYFPNFKKDIPEFLTNKPVEAIVEIKLGNKKVPEDIEKLEYIQKKHENLLYVIIYLGHFNEKIHKSNAKEDERRKKKIDTWMEEDKENRLGIIIRFDQDKLNPILKKILETFWKTDKDKKKK